MSTFFLHHSYYKIVIAFCLLINILCLPTSATAQADSSWRQAPQLQLGGFVDVFFAYDFDQPTGEVRQLFFYNHNRHQEFNVNLALARVQLQHSKYRANLGLQAGTYAQDNYAAEPDLLKTIFEANVGLSLNKKNTIWIDAGVLPSPIGFESALSTKNYTLTRSLSAENSPYFLTGAKLSFLPSEQWEVALLVVNGWQRIQRLLGNTLPSFCTQVTYTPSENFTLNWSTFIGTDDPDHSRRMRYFSNLYTQWQPHPKVGILAGFDIGIQQSQPESSNYHSWFSPTLIAQYQLSKRWQMALRAEYYHDPNEVIVASLFTNGFQSLGFSWNLDYSPIPALKARLEARWLHSQEAVFLTGSSQNNVVVALSLAANFSRVVGGRP